MMLPGLFPDENKVLSVAELTREIKHLLEDAFPSVWVSGQISNYRPASSGHLYFTLKDAEAQLPAVLWRSLAARLRFEAHDGLEVIARGRVEVYPPHGKYQLIVEELQPKGIGALELAFRQLCEKLEKLGFFAPARKRPIPRFPRRVALVTSPTGAAIRDMLEILGRRWPAVEVLICPVRVQGEGAAAEIAAALALVNELHQRGMLALDVVVVGRGGGSLEDLWAFNEEIVAQAIFQSLVPIVSGVGHETDLTIADKVADVRALTPSEAAERIVPNRVEVLEILRGAGNRMHLLLRRRLDAARSRLDDLAQRRVFRLPLEPIRDREQRLDELAERLQRAAHLRLGQCKDRLQSLSSRLETLSPLNVLGRGYSLTRKQADGAVLRAADQVKPGDRLVTQLAQGKITSRVESVDQDSNPVGQDSDPDNRNDANLH